MRTWPLLILALLFCTAASAQIGTQLDQNQFRLRQLQNDLDIARIQAQTDQIRRATERMRAESEQARRDEQLNDLLNQRAADQSAAAKKAEDAADELREELHLASVRTADTAYLIFAVALPICFAFFVARKAGREGEMKYEQKFGVVLMIGAALVALLALTLSEDWAPRLDALQNILLTLRIKLFAETESAYSQHLVDIPTKFVLAGLAVVSAYGFTTYLGITPAWKRAVKADTASESPTGNSTETP